MPACVLEAACQEGRVTPFANKLALGEALCRASTEAGSLVKVVFCIPLYQNRTHPGQWRLRRPFAVRADEVFHRSQRHI